MKPSYMVSKKARKSSRYHNAHRYIQHKSHTSDNIFGSAKQRNLIQGLLPALMARLFNRRSSNRERKPI